MRENKGFTLIELLAVIVILAIIAVITVPKVAEMIESSRKGSAEDAFYGSIKAAELAWAKELQNNSSLSKVNCTFASTGVATCTIDGGSDTINYSSSGATSTGGTINISGDGNALVASTSPLIFNGYKCCGNSNKAYCDKDAGNLNATKCPAMP